MRHLGIMTLFYNSDGSFNSGSFVPDTLRIHENSTGADFIRYANVFSHANIVLAQWFAQQNETELADRDKFEIQFFRKDVNYYIGSIQERKIVLDVTLNEKTAPVAS